MRFANNGYCLDRIFAFDWNTLDRNHDHVDDLDAFIDDVLSETGAARVDLAAHSAGGNLSYEYLAAEDRAAKVAHYAHIASFLMDAPAGPTGDVPTLNLWSDGDLVIDEKGDIEGATNVMLPNVDHFSLVTVEDGFDPVFALFNDGGEPTTTEAGTTEPIVVSGRAGKFGENTAAPGALVEIFEVDSATGFRLSEVPNGSYVADDSGDWGPFIAQPEAHYEFRVLAEGDDVRPIHYYREPFSASNDLVYLRTFPNDASMVGLLLSSIPFSDDHAILVTFTSNSATIAGQDTLTVNEIEVSTEEIAPAEKTLIAAFYFDANRNGVSDATSISSFGTFPFLGGLDMFFSAETEASIDVVYNGRTVRARNWPSETEGASVIVFD